MLKIARKTTTEKLRKKKNWEIKLYPKPILENARKHNTEAYISLAVIEMIISLALWSKENSIIDSWKNEKKVNNFNYEISYCFIDQAFKGWVLGTMSYVLQTAILNDFFHT